MYIKNNTSKQFIFDFIDSTGFQNILDFACWTCSPWVDYLNKNKNINYYWIDYNANSINKAHQLLPERKDNIILQDGQKNFDIWISKFDIVNTFSSLEHVVDKDLFIENMIWYIKDDWLLILNYDSGHFRTWKIKDKILNPISVLLSFFWIQKYYTKYVNENEVLSILKKYKITIIEKKYFNISALKWIHKNISDEKILESWYNYELELNEYSDKSYLEKIFTSTVIIWKKWI